MVQPGFDSLLGRLVQLVDSGWSLHKLHVYIIIQGCALRKQMKGAQCLYVTLFGKSGLNENCIEPFFIATHLETLECIGEHS